MREELAQLRKELKKQAEALEEARRARELAMDGWKKAKARLAEKRAAVSAARAEERRTAATKVAEAKASSKRKMEERLGKVVERKVAKLVAEEQERAEVARGLLLKARARARAVEGEASVSGKRLKRARRAEAALKLVREQLDELMQEQEPEELESADEQEEDVLEPQTKCARRGDKGRYVPLRWNVRPIITPSSGRSSAAVWRRAQ